MKKKRKKSRYKTEYNNTIKEFTTQYLMDEIDILNETIDSRFMEFKLSGNPEFLNKEMYRLCLEKRLCEKELERRAHEYDIEHKLFNMSI